jgi:hypothetical protein
MMGFARARRCSAADGRRLSSDRVDHVMDELTSRGEGVLACRRDTVLGVTMLPFSNR